MTQCFQTDYRVILPILAVNVLLRQFMADIQTTIHRLVARPMEETLIQRTRITLTSENSLIQTRREGKKNEKGDDREKEKSKRFLLT